MARKKTDKTVALENAIISVLTQAKEPLHYSDLAMAISEKKLFVQFGPKPAAEVYSLIANNMSTQKEASLFERVGTGIYTLNSHKSNKWVSSYETPSGIVAPTTTVVESSTNADVVESETVEKDIVEDTESKSIVTSFGIYWRRDWVAWRTIPTLYGRQQEGSQPVDFANQIGVYLLYDAREVIYAGLVIDQPLGQRLNQHLVDRLGGRWDRFSWFGLKPLTSTGALEPALDPIVTSVSDMISTMEALLIEVIEPRQNRRKGDKFAAVEYLQVEDPEITRKQKRQLLREFTENLNQK